MADSVLGGVGGGAMKGAALGAQLGTVVPGVGNAVGTVGGALIGGIAGGLKSKKAKNTIEDAESYMPAYADPVQSQRLAEIDRIAKNIQAGTDVATKTAVDQANQTIANTQSRLARVTGGNIGATTDALLKAQRAGGEAKNTAIAQGQTRLPYFMGIGQQLADRVEQRKLELQLLNRAQGMAEGAQAQKENVINRNSVIASGLGLNEIGEAVNSPEAQDAKSRVSNLLNNLKIRQTQDGVGTGAGIAPPAEMSSSLGIPMEAAQSLSSFMNRGI